MKNEPVKAKEPTRPAAGGRAPRWLSSLFNFRFFSDEMPRISPLAVIDPSASIATDVEIGPFCVIGPDVTLEGGCRLLNSVTIIGKTTIGRDNVFFPNCVIGTYPQDKKFKGAATELHIGSGNVFREAVTVHIGTEKGGGITRVGNNNMFMINTHIGHDAQIGSDCVLANNVMIAGHVIVGDHVNMMGLAGVHHFVTIGRFAYLGGACRIHHDVPPFVKVDGADEIRGLNKVGLTRAGFSQDDIKGLDWAYRKLFNRKRPLSQALSEMESMNGQLSPNVMEIVEFLRRRDLGKHGRYLEGRRGGLAAAVAEATAAAAPVARDPVAAAEPAAQAPPATQVDADAPKPEAAPSTPRTSRRAKADAVAAAAAAERDREREHGPNHQGNGETSRHADGNIPA